MSRHRSTFDNIQNAVSQRWKYRNNFRVSLTCCNWTVDENTWQNSTHFSVHPILNKTISTYFIYNEHETLLFSVITFNLRPNTFLPRCTKDGKNEKKKRNIIRPIKI